MIQLAMDIPVCQIKPIYDPHHHQASQNSSTVNTLFQTLNLQPHPEGGYFAETDRPPPLSPMDKTETRPQDHDHSLPAASSTIFYLLTPNAPLGMFHRDRARTIHTWHRGRGRYVIIHADEASCSHTGLEKSERGEEKVRLESFVVGPDVARGEHLQWVVGAGKYKASYLLPDISTLGDSEGLLISEVVVPGFDFVGLDFLRKDKMEELLTAEQVRELSWMLKTPEE
ncbi:DUF985 domain protein [Penicillium brasilianum]|uniref:DUF985 domain protein n=1 Tax=Penicillium brasilianum TaxID=104259 RepID=A0A1S9RWH6_PENBI|nr:DUF985 domain protein [Penicillium brasilianum]